MPYRLIKSGALLHRRLEAFLHVHGSQGGENVCLNQTDKQAEGDPDHRYEPRAEELQNFQQDFTGQDVAE